MHHVKYNRGPLVFQNDIVNVRIALQQTRTRHQLINSFEQMFSTCSCFSLWSVLGCCWWQNSQEKHRISHSLSLYVGQIGYFHKSFQNGWSSVNTMSETSESWPSPLLPLSPLRLSVSLCPPSKNAIPKENRLVLEPWARGLRSLGTLDTTFLIHSTYT
jgi:hypothetical protein